MPCDVLADLKGTTKKSRKIKTAPAIIAPMTPFFMVLGSPCISSKNMTFS